VEREKGGKKFVEAKLVVGEFRGIIIERVLGKPVEHNAEAGCKFSPFRILSSRSSRG